MDAFRTYAETARCLTGAQTASLLIDPVSRLEFAPILLKTGDPRPIPGFETEDSALLAISKLRQSKQDVRLTDSSSAVHYYRGMTDDTHHFCIAISELSSLAVPQHSAALRLERRAHPPVKVVDGPKGDLWIGLRFNSSGTPKFLLESSVKAAPSGNGESLCIPQWLTQVLVSGAQLAWQVYELSVLLKDPITGLARRSALQIQVNRSLRHASERGRSCALALLNPNEFEQVNQRHGRERGDAILREIGSVLEHNIRDPDTVCHYGGAVFAALLWLADESEAKSAADRLRIAISEHKYLNGEIKLDFNVGVSCFGGQLEAEADLDADEILRRADSALNASKSSSGARIRLWTPRGLTSSSYSHDRLSGIFTADSRKDYRNMLLLWEMVQVISYHTETNAIIDEFMDRVNRTFKPDRAALISSGGDGQPGLMSISRCMSRSPDTEGADNVPLLLLDDQRHLLARVQQTRSTGSAQVAAPGRGNKAAQRFNAYAVPIIGGNKYMACLYVDGPESSFHLDSSDLIFLTVLANQVAMALDRSELALRWQREKERETNQLREEVRKLRQALDNSSLVYRSSMMQSVLEVVRKVAPTDATVLISGESGTGKEMVARFLREQSLRGKGPFVTVDCGSIAPSLIEAELFGHAKGAYTGAIESSKGRIVQSEGGTIFLDEIGELRLDLQAKLLRFVQEREITPVGANRSRKIDVRIVAATNRDLAAEVDAGRFRQDLYYRLQVVSVTVPPLRQRPEDILPLAQHFMETFATEYKKGVQRLNADAQRALLEHPWPGNVRELQNRLRQAVIMYDRVEIGRFELHLDGASAGEHRLQVPIASSAAGAERPTSVPVFASSPPVVDSSSRGDSQVGAPSDGSPWEALRGVLARQIEVALHDKNVARVPLGVWLTEDLVLAADEAHGGVARKASDAIGMAETTFRRHLEKARYARQQGMASRCPQWSTTKPVIDQLVRSTHCKQGENVVLRARGFLLAEVLLRLPHSDLRGAVLMGVTTPTYRRWKSEDLPSRFEEATVQADPGPR